MGRKKNAKTRADFRKNRTTRSRDVDWTKRYGADGFDGEDAPTSERISGKGELTRRRTIVGQTIDAESSSAPGAAGTIQLEIDSDVCLPGRVLRAHGLVSEVFSPTDGIIYRCATRRLLKTLSTDQRHVVVAGDHVMFRPVPQTKPAEGVIERVEPRRQSICRASRGRRHVLVTNVDQLLIVASAAEPRLKPGLIDRMLVVAEQNGIRPLICINKVDLVDAARLAPLCGVYAQMGYDVLLISATSGRGIPQLRSRLEHCESVVAGQSGVGKSSILNAIDPALQRRVGAVSSETEKGRHTTTSAELLQLSFGGFIVDTPGIRQFQLWDVIPEEVAGFFRDIRPLVNRCRYPNCSHTHEADCAVKDAVADGRLDERRYESYCHMFLGDDA